MSYFPQTPTDIATMLASLAIDDVSQLFSEIPTSLHYSGFTDIPASLNEMMMLKDAQYLGKQNNNVLCFLGAGSYNHHIPAAVWDIASRGEFLTAYTPYQAEASQGTLQLLYEFQTMIAELTSLDAANASLYDGATALAEAVLMAVRLKKIQNPRVLVAGTIHPFYLQTLNTIVRNQNIEIISLPYDKKSGITTIESLTAYDAEEIVALVVVQPNFFGCIELVDGLVDWALNHSILTIGCVNPVAMALLKPPGEWGRQGVDIACGEGQPLGVPMAGGGPYFGFISCKMEHIRQMPGRIIGQTVDQAGNRGFSLTLQAREQHIRRGKATSNICTNQGLLVTAATIHMSLLGPDGLKNVALQCHRNTVKLAHLLTAIPGIKKRFTSAFFHEIVLQCKKPVPEILQALQQEGINGGFPLVSCFSKLEDSLLVCATETLTDDDLQQYNTALTKIMSN